MAFDSGSLNFRLFYLKNDCDSSMVDAFADHVIQPLEQLHNQPLTGWIGCRHLLDREIKDETCVIGSTLLVQSLKMEKKIPPALLRALCKQEECKLMAERMVNFLSNRDKREIRQRITEETKKEMPPTLEAIACAFDFRERYLVATATSAKQVDALNASLKSAIDNVPTLALPEAVALKRKQFNAKDITHFTVFTPNEDVAEPAHQSLGSEFLTWLLYAWETGSNIWKLTDGQQFGIELLDPVTFHRDGEGAQEAVLRKGEVLRSPEAITALMRGKTIVKIKMMVAFSEQVKMQLTLDDEFVFHSVTLPKNQAREFNAKIDERMAAIELLVAAIFTLYDAFLDLRKDAASWKVEVKKVRDWISGLAR